MNTLVGVSTGVATTDLRLLYTALIGAGFLLGTVLVYAIGRRLKSVLGEGDLAEALQSLAVTGLGIVAGGMLVVLWGLEGSVGGAFSEIAVGADAAVLVMISLLVFGVAYTVTRITKRLIKKGEKHDTITTHQKEVAHHVVQVLIVVPTVLFVLALWGARPGDLLLGAGAAGVVVGFAARQTLGSVLAGFVLLFARPFDIGDWVIISDREGTVTDVDIFNTEIRTFDNEYVLVPNDQVTADDIVNRSRSGRLRLQVDVGVDYDTDVREAMGVAEEAMLACDVVPDSPEPSVVLDEFGASAVVLTLRFWIEDPTVQRKWEAQNAVVDAVKTAFEEAGIEIPFPQRVVSGREEAPSAGLVQGAATADGGESADGPVRGGE